MRARCSSGSTDDSKTLNLRFLLPSDQNVYVWVNDEDAQPYVPRLLRFERQMKIYKSKWLMKHKNVSAYFPEARDHFALYEARFPATVPKGKSRISVRYEQRLSMTWRPGYIFSGASGSLRLLYYLGPLKEWTLANDFKIDVKVTWSKSRRNWFKRLLGWPVREISCDVETGNVSRERGNFYETTTVEFALNRDFPAVLECQTKIESDEDLYDIYEDLLRHHEIPRLSTLKKIQNQLDPAPQDEEPRLNSPDL